MFFIESSISKEQKVVRNINYFKLIDIFFDNDLNIYLVSALGLLYK